MPTIKSPTKQRVLLIDIESSPNIAYVWGKYEQNAVGDFIQERQIISFSWKWLGEKNTHFCGLPMFNSYRLDPANNRELVVKLHEIISGADVVVGHNLVQFDDKMANTDFIVNGLPPPPPHKVVDTLKIARSKFKFNSNKLDDLGARLKLGRKRPTGGFSLWLGCMRGDAKSWKRMEEYNKGDVSLLEKIYLRLKPWIDNRPSSHYGRTCPACGRSDAVSRGWSLSISGRRRRFQCKCGSWFATGLVKNNG